MSSEVASTSAPTPTPRRSRGANPSTDYKSLFLKSKDKYDRVSTDHTELKASVTKATAKQQKLREELDYLLDAVAAKRAQREQIEQSHRDHALELEREAAAAVAAAEAARRRATSMASRERERGGDVYEPRVAHRGYEGGEEYRSYSARYAEPSYQSFGTGMNRGYASPPPPPPPAAVGSAGARTSSFSSQRGADRYPASDGSPQALARRDSHPSGSYHPGPSQSPPPPPGRPLSAASSSHRPHPRDPHSSPSRYDSRPRYRESTPPLPPSSTSSAVKRPRPTSVERELLDVDDGYHIKRPRND
ncbi:hypothetical protein EX895_002502 [Sporisorium graminicola]|uniref:Uncharacterized protein n=1 Tax=Sporisorium graminicola TaxID=280036 RepID=A0A4U7KV35_9BASI|nr:hypothetical protein EX895_002502 [Sporisorium graminicola]TKY88514.1 hypothetical protein EX895_002502 [Sporisorium graminicola]